MTVPPPRRPPDEMTHFPTKAPAFGAFSGRWLTPGVQARWDLGRAPSAWADDQEEPGPGLPNGRWGRIATHQLAQVDRVVSQIAAAQRMPRVCRYALTHGAHRPAQSLSAAFQYAALRGWQVGGEEQAFTDPHGSPAPRLRTGWTQVMRHLRAGYADGVVVVTQSVLTTDPAEFEQELRWVADHKAFLAVVAPTAMPRRENKRS